MTMKLSKTLIIKSKIRNKYFPSRENVLTKERAKKYCNILTEATEKNYFQEVTKSGFANNKEFWNAVKTFLSDRGFVKNDNIRKTKDKPVAGDKSSAHMFSSHYIITLEKNYKIYLQSCKITEMKIMFL